MSTQINVRVSNEFLAQAKEYAKNHGFLTVQEFIREAAREKIYDDLEIRPEYLKSLNSKDATTFLSEEEAKEFEEDLRRRANEK